MKEYETRTSGLTVKDEVLSDERSQIFSFITERVLGVESFLDIGVGDGNLTDKLASFYNFKKIVVVEPNLTNYLNFCKSHNGYTILNKKWEETELKEEFDLILCSHSAYFFEKTVCLSLIDKAVSNLSREGTFFLIVNRDDAPIQRLYDFLKIQGIRSPHVTLKFDDVIQEAPQYLNSGKPEIITPNVECSRPGRLVNFLWDFMSPDARVLDATGLRAGFESLVGEIVGETNVFPFPSNVYKFTKTDLTI